MAISMARFMLFTIVISSFALIISNNIIMASAQCAGDMQGLMQECARYVQKSGPMVPPSAACCDVVKNLDLPCVCSHITSEVEGVISMEKAAFIAQACGKPLARGSHCGSYIVQGN
ncbi:uncharacterized protein LOC143608313 [Bidens hawaiensis]|uniref:uncharacterized protein LOC143608312 n=1 Tax=Bidens hawaiensis TaxID=980011 RepID=UPI004049F4FA